MQTEDLEKLTKAATEFVRVVRYVSPPVKRVKGFDQNTVKAERRKAARAKQHNKRMRRNPSHGSQSKAPAV